jgi:hypothetical protein
LGKPAQAIGRVSYGIYLWHIPVIRVLSPDRVHLAAVPLAFLRLAVLAAVVNLSYRFIEQPVRSRRWRPTLPRLVVVAVVVVAALIPLEFDAQSDFRHQWDATDMPAGVARADRVLVVGDGVAGFVADGFRPATTWDASEFGCGLLPGPMVQSGQVLRPGVACSHWERRWADAVDQFRPTIVVVMESTWDLIPRADGTPVDRLALPVYKRAAAILERHGAGVVWVKPIDPSGVSPVPPGDVATRRANAVAIGRVVDELGDAALALDVSAISLGIPAGDSPVLKLTPKQVTLAGSRLGRILPG